MGEVPLVSYELSSMFSFRTYLPGGNHRELLRVSVGGSGELLPSEYPTIVPRNLAPEPQRAGGDRVAALMWREPIGQRAASADADRSG